MVNTTSCTNDILTASADFWRIFNSTPRNRDGKVSDSVWKGFYLYGGRCEGPYLPASVFRHLNIGSGRFFRENSLRIVGFFPFVSSFPLPGCVGGGNGGWRKQQLITLQVIAAPPVFSPFSTKCVREFGQPRFHLFHSLTRWTIYTKHFPDLSRDITKGQLEGTREPFPIYETLTLILKLNDHQWAYFTVMIFLLSCPEI